MSSYQIEPELWRPAPRTLRRKPKASGQIGVGCLRVFMLPFIAVGLWLLGSALLATVVGAFGRVVPATILSHYTKTDSDGDTTYYLDYRFAMNGQMHFVRESVPFNEYSFWRDGSTLQVRALSFAPSRGAQLQLGSRSGGRKVLLAWCFALFWNAIISVFLWVAWVQPLVNRSLVARGLPTIGRISDKKTLSGEDSTSYQLSYEYAPIEYSMSGPKVKGDAFAPQAASSMQTPPLIGKMTVAPTDYQSANIGDVTTVLFSKNRPKSSLIYRFAEWEVVS